VQEFGQSADMNKIIESLLSRKSVRAYENSAISEEVKVEKKSAEAIC
jgi:hypothetical protein